MKLPKKNYAFVDGSFNPANGVYGCGGFLIDQFGKKHIIQACGKDPEMAKMRNVAGEILGAKEAVRLALDLGMKTLKIFHDYEGVAMWPMGLWKTKKPVTKDYALFMRGAVASGLNLTFEHVKGHSGIPGNNEADRLAKEAVGIFLKAVTKTVKAAA